MSRGVRVRGDVEYRAAAVILTTGTFLQALMHTGEVKTPGGRAGEGTTAGISGGAEAARLSSRAVQDRHAAAAEWPHDRLHRNASCSRATTIREPFSFLTDELARSDRSNRCPAGSRTPTSACTI